MKAPLIIICTLALTQSLAQKGASKDKPWVEEFTIVNLPAKHAFKYYNLFGKWEFTVTGSAFLTTHETRNENELKAIPFLLGWPSDVYHKISRSNILELKATDDKKNKYIGKYTFTDSTLEEYTERFLKNNENYKYHFFQKKAEGFILTSTMDSVSFKLLLDYDVSGNPINDQSSIFLPNKIIKIQPVFIEENERDPSRGVYGGFRFMDNGIVVAEAIAGKGFVGSPSHRFWLSNSLNITERQVIGALLFIIVYFY